ncbi:sensor histidine kinase [Saccharothrix deserti]|uniref:sensor histidine kinase n=1 Tax=Saccharothrix deserti TaxID=2593674 RepID=UPI00192E55A3|nr:sensor histidine kinase [Saccharothrix deserti]
MRRIRQLLDVVVSIVVGAYVALVVMGTSEFEPAITVPTALLALAAAAALWWRRRAPVPVMGFTLAADLVVQLVAPETVFPVAALVATGSLAAARSPWFSLPALGLLLALISLNFRTITAEDTQFVMAVAVVVWALGEAVRNRRVAVSQAAQRAVSEEQARIARELHDVIAHGVSVIVVQAAAADDVFDQRPDRAREALRSIDATARATLDELRKLLGAVRPEERPGLDRLADLVEPLRAAGLRVEITHESAPLPAGVDLSAYRIVQEALTNTLRHAQASRAEVLVRNDSGVLDLEVRDDGRGGVAGFGRGITGMRERAALLGGTVDAGPLPDGGFRVHARLPLAVTA